MYSNICTIKYFIVHIYFHLYMKQVAIVGIQGVPAKYGGFETLVENIIGDNCSPGSPLYCFLQQ